MHRARYVKSTDTQYAVLRHRPKCDDAVPQLSNSGPLTYLSPPRRARVFGPFRDPPPRARRQTPSPPPPPRIGDALWRVAAGVPSAAHCAAVGGGGSAVGFHSNHSLNNLFDRRSMVLGFSMGDLAAFWNVGYTIKRKVFRGSLCDEALHEVEHLDFEPVFRKVYAKRLDPYRGQADLDVNSDGLANIHSVVAGLVEAANTQWEVNEGTWHAMKSLPGGRTQAPHQDFPTFEITQAFLRHRVVQGSVIVALMDNTAIHVYQGCLGGPVEKGGRVTLLLSRGDLLLFRGDLAHAGAKYEEENIRLHCYVRVIGIPQKPTATEVVLFKTHDCKNCMHMFYSRRDLREHKSACTTRGTFPCPYCDSSYNIRNSLTKHIGREHRNEHQPCRARARDAEEGKEDDSEDGEDPNDDEEDDDDVDCSGYNLTHYFCLHVALRV